MKKNNMPVKKVFTSWCISPYIWSKNKESVCPLNIITLFLLMLFILMPVHSQSNKTEEEVILAYELRTVGKYDEAKTKLEKILQQDSNNAMANFEMTRLMNSYNIMNVDTSLYYCSRAAQLKPKNSLYAFSKANLVLLKAFIAMQKENNTLIKPLIGEACEAFQHVLDIKPGCKETMLYLIDLYGSLPEEMGGDKGKAEHYVQELENMDKFYGARGRLILLQGDTSEVKYWKNYISENGESNEALAILGKAFLMSDDIENAEKYFIKVIDTDPTRQLLLLDLARAHIFRVMQGKPGEEEIPLAKEYFQKYLSSDREKPVCVESWCYGMLSRLEKFLGNNEQSDKYMAQATSLNPYFSRATAIPTIDAPPNEISYSFLSYFRPF